MKVKLIGIMKESKAFLHATTKVVADILSFNKLVE